MNARQYPATASPLNGVDSNQYWRPYEKRFVYLFCVTIRKAKLRPLRAALPGLGAELFFFA